MDNASKGKKMKIDSGSSTLDPREGGNSRQGRAGRIRRGPREGRIMGGAAEGSAWRAEGRVIIAHTLDAVVEKNGRANRRSGIKIEIDVKTETSFWGNEWRAGGGDPALRWSNGVALSPLYKLEGFNLWFQLEKLRKLLQ